MGDVEKVKEAINIVDVIGNYVELKNAGSNYKGLCPFHNEKTPSFMVNPNLQIYKCFGCSRGGDVFNFLMEIERLDFPEALKKAADSVGIQLKENIRPRNKKEEELKERILKANDLSSKFYNHILKTHKAGKPGRDYAMKRGIGADEIEKFRVGFAPKNKQNLKNFLNSRGFEDKELIDFGLLIDRNGTVIDKFRNRLLQPIFNEKGEVVGFSGRYIEKSDYAPKYLNSPETPVYKKQELLYGLFQAKESLRKEKFLILVEGNIDIISSHRVGVENIVAPLGTAFTIGQARKIKRFADEIYFCFDTDGAGINALIRSIPIAEEVGLNHKVVELGDFQDADEMINRDEKKWKEALSNPKDSIMFLKKLFAKDLDLGTAEGKRNFQNRIVPILQSIKDETVKDHYIKDISVTLEITRDDLKSIVQNNKKLKLHSVSIDESEKDIRVNKTTLSQEEYLLSLILQNNMKDFFLTIPEDFLSNQNLQEFIYKIVEQDQDISKSVKDVKDESIKIALERVLLMDITDVEDIDHEVDELYVRLYRNYLKRKILEVRRKISTDDESDDALSELQSLTMELKTLQGITFFS